MINGKRLKLGPKRQSQSPQDQFGARSELLPMPPACLLHWRGEPYSDALSRLVSPCAAELGGKPGGKACVLSRVLIEWRRASI